MPYIFRPPSRTSYWLPVKLVPTAAPLTSVDTSVTFLWNDKALATTSLTALWDDIGHDDDWIPLCITGAESIEDDLDLYILGAEIINESMNLFVEGAVPDSLIDDIPLTIYGANDPTLFGGIELFILGESSKEVTLNLFIESHPSGDLDDSLNLVLESAAPEESLDLFIAGYGWQSAADELPLVVWGSPVGAYDDAMNLFLDRPTVNLFPMTIFGPPANHDDELTLVIQGAEVINDDLMLSLPNVTETYTDSLDLYTHGF